MKPNKGFPRTLNTVLLIVSILLLAAAIALTVMKGENAEIKNVIIYIVAAAALYFSILSVNAKEKKIYMISNVLIFCAWATLVCGLIANWMRGAYVGVNFIPLIAGWLLLMIVIVFGIGKTKTIKTVDDAVENAQNNEYEQMLKDGLITEEEYKDLMNKKTEG